MSDTESRSSSLLTWLIDPLRSTADSAPDAFTFTGDRRTWLVPIALGLALLAISALGWLVEPARFYASYLVGWSFCLTISIGALFFLFFNHLTKAGWSIVVNRINESLLWGFPMLAVLFIPVLFGMDDLYKWTNPELYIEGGPKYDVLIAGKAPYLNTPFWGIRMALYFVVWSVLSYRLYTLSVRQDVTGDPEIMSKLRSTSAWGLPLTAITVAFASYDIIMSTDAHWYSTIFGIYLFAGGMLALIATMVIMGTSLQRSGMLTDTITPEHYHDLGKYLFGFTVFWAYIAFSQYLLIWYAGIPEVTIFYRHRMEHAWEWHSAMLILFHFAVPFLLLLPQITKRIPVVLGILAVWLFGMHWFDLHWNVMPNLFTDGGFHWVDFTTWLGLLGLFIGAAIYRLSRHALVPHRHPYLQESMHFENV